MTGVVKTLNDKPLGRVVIVVDGHATTSGDDGRFVLHGLRAGAQKIWIDARTASVTGRAYGTFVLGVDLRAGVVNEYPQVIWMPAIDTRHVVKIAALAVEDVFVTHPAMPGLSLRIPAGTVIRDHDGKPVSEVSITPVPSGKVPYPMVPGYPFNWYYMLQPGGATLETPKGAHAQLTYPNWNHAPIHFRYLLASYQPARGYNGWESTAEAWVEDGGERIVPEPNGGITAFYGAGVFTGPNPPPQPCIGPSCPKPCGGCNPKDSPPQSGNGRTSNTAADPVSVTTGLFARTETDVYLPDVMPIELNRSHVAGDTLPRSFGIATNSSFEIYLWRPDPAVWSNLTVVFPDGQRVSCPRTNAGTGPADGVFVCTDPPGPMYKALIRYNTDALRLEMSLQDGTSYIFGHTGAKVRAVRDRNGNELTISRYPFDGGNVTQVVSPNGRSIALHYDGVDRIDQIKDHTGRTWSYAYDAQGRLFQATDPDNKVSEYTYESTTSPRMRTYKDPRGNVIFTNLYDANGRVSKQTLIDGAAFDFTYTLNGSAVTRTDVKDQRGNTRRVQINPAGFITSDTYALGLPEQQVYTYTYDPITNRMLTETDGLSRTTAFTYDALGNVATVTRMSGTAQAVTTTYTYEPRWHQLATITDPLTHTTSFGYDLRGNLTTITNALNQTTTFAYNLQGQVTSVTDPLTHVTTLTYNNGDLATVTDALSRTSTVFADALGRVRAVRDPLGNLMVSTYDVRDRLTQSADPLNGTTQWSYDANGNVLSFRDPKNNLTQFTYDTLDRLKTRQDALLRTDTWDYDIAGRLLRFTDRKSQVSGFTYDALNRLKTSGFGATIANPTTYTSTITNTWDAANRLTQVADTVSGTITRQYDVRFDTLTQEVSPFGTYTGTVNYQYDSAGRRSQMQVGGQPAVTYGYDNANRLTAITQGSNAVSFGYDAASRRMSASLPFQVSIDYGYDNANQLTGLTHKRAGTTLQTLVYGYDAAGRRTGMSGTAARINLPPALASAATYDANNRLANWAGAAQTYDFNGNLTGDGVNTYTWDARDRLSAVAGATPFSNGYDTFDRRVSRTAGGTQSWTLYDGFNELHGITSAGALVSTFLYGPGLDERYVRANSSNGITDLYLTDALGSTLSLVSSAGVINGAFTYEPYGTSSLSGSNSTGLRYTGRVEDTPNLMYYRARFYNPRTSRFISEDPIGLAGGYNLYAYVGGSPTNATDPTGLDTYVINRHLAATSFEAATSRSNPISHTFVATTNSDGSVRNTYSWGTDANLTGWAKNFPLDVKTAQDALSRNLAERVGGVTLDASIPYGYSAVNRPENAHINGIITNNCKDEAKKLIDAARRIGSPR